MAVKSASSAARPSLTTSRMRRSGCRIGTRASRSTYENKAPVTASAPRIPAPCRCRRQRILFACACHPGLFNGLLNRRGYYNIQLERASLPYSFNACKRGVRYHVHVNYYGNLVQVDALGPCDSYESNTYGRRRYYDRYRYREGD